MQLQHLTPLQRYILVCAYAHRGLVWVMAEYGVRFVRAGRHSLMSDREAGLDALAELRGRGLLAQQEPDTYCLTAEGVQAAETIIRAVLAQKQR